MTAGNLCVREVDLAVANESVQVAAQRMHTCNVGTLVILDSQKRPLGMITDRDLAVRVMGLARDPNETTVGDVMTHCLRSITEDSSIEDVLRNMRAGRCRRLPVVNHAGQLVGILSVDDVLESLISEFRDIGRLLNEESPSRLARE